MKTEEATSSTWEDLVFENRNKAYGAFSIRKSYSKNVVEALLCSMLLAAMVLMDPRILSLLGVEQTQFVSTKVVPETYTIRPQPLIEQNKKMVRTQPNRLIKEHSHFQVTSLIVPDASMKEQSTGAATGSVEEDGQTMSQGQDLAPMGE